MMWFLIALIWLALIVGIIWWYQQKQRERDAASEQRFKQIFGGGLSGTASSTTALPPELMLLQQMPASAPATSVTSTTYTRKPRLLPQRHALLYYILRTGLPDHEIFADHALADFIEVSGMNREPALRQLATQRADFIVCNKQMEVIAAVIVGNTGISNAAREALQTTNVRLLILNPDALPKHTQVRALIYD